MSNMPNINNGQVVFRLPLQIIAKIRSAARKIGVDTTTFVSMILEKATRNVELTDEEWDWVKSQTRKNSEKRKSKK